MRLGTHTREKGPVSISHHELVLMLKVMHLKLLAGLQQIGVVRKPSTYIIGCYLQKFLITQNFVLYSPDSPSLLLGVLLRVRNETISSLCLQHSFYTRSLASFPGPTQLSIACSMESWVGWAWEQGYQELMNCFYAGQITRRFIEA